MLYSKIVKEEGFKGLYTGLAPNILRSSIMNATELATYDQIKTLVVHTFGFNQDNKFVHLFCGFAAGFVAVVCSSPIDVIKTRVMNVVFI